MSDFARNWGIGVSNEPRPQSSSNWLYYGLGVPTAIGLFAIIGLAVAKLWWG